MADFKNYGQKGVNPDLQYGKKGGRLKYFNDEFFVRDDTDTFYLNVHAKDPTEDTHLTTKRYVDAQVAQSASQNPGFYGVVFEESDGSNSFKSDRLRFLNTDFDIAADVNGKPQVSLSANVAHISDIGPGFYGIKVGETDGSPIYTGLNGIKFNSDHFYVTQNSSNTDEAIVNLKGSFRDPLFRTQIIGTGASQNIGTPLPASARVQTVKLKVTAAYNNTATISINDGTNTYMSTAENDPDFTQTFISETEGDTVVAGTGQIVATVGNSPTTGTAVVTIDYRIE